MNDLFDWLYYIIALRWTGNLYPASHSVTAEWPCNPELKKIGWIFIKRTFLGGNKRPTKRSKLNDSSFFFLGVQSLSMSQVAMLNNVCWLSPSTVPLKFLSQGPSAIVIQFRRPQGPEFTTFPPKWRKTSLAQWAISLHLSTHKRMDYSGITVEY